jgi:hypothetical protein
VPNFSSVRPFPPSLVIFYRRDFLLLVFCFVIERRFGKKNPDIFRCLTIDFPSYPLRLLLRKIEKCVETVQLNDMKSDRKICVRARLKTVEGCGKQRKDQKVFLGN